MDTNGTAQGDGRDPSGFLSEIIGSPVTVKLNSGVVYKGKAIYVALMQSMANRIHRVITISGTMFWMCRGFYRYLTEQQDGYMNLALENTEEHVDGVKKRSYGDAFVRGNNGLS
jgi:U6 snRNA-associated Sm-like protein LSm6